MALRICPFETLPAVLHYGSCYIKGMLYKGYTTVESNLPPCEGGARRDKQVRPPPYTLDSTPYTLHSTPYTLHSTPFTLHSTPHTLHSTPYILHPTLLTLHPTSYTLRPALFTPNHTPCALHSIPCTLKPKPPARLLYLTQSF